MKIEFADQEVKEFMDSLAEVISKGEYALVNFERAKIITDYIKNNMIFVEAGAEDLVPLPGYLVYYSYRDMMIPKQMNTEDIQVEILKKVLHIALMDIVKDDTIITVNTGFLSLLFISQDTGTVTCTSIIDKEINSVALITYSRFLNGYRQKNCNSLDEFISQELIAYKKTKEYGFMLLNSIIGNELMFKTFKLSDVKMLDDYLENSGTSFIDISDVFKKDYNLEFLRTIINKLKKGDIVQCGNEGMGKIVLTSEVFEELLENLKSWLAIGLVDAQAIELMKTVEEYFFEGFKERFGTEIDINEEADEIKVFYSDYFGQSPSDKLKFFKNYSYGKKYSQLKEKSYDLVIRSMNDGKPNRDISDEARKILAEVEKVNKSLEKEPEEIQLYHFEESKEILLNCMSAPMADKPVLGKECGELAEIFELVKLK